jgi:hypothetical protein
MAAGIFTFSYPSSSSSHSSSNSSSSISGDLDACLLPVLTDEVDDLSLDRRRDVPRQPLAAEPEIVLCLDCPFLFRAGAESGSFIIIFRHIQIS